MEGYILPEENKNRKNDDAYSALPGKRIERRTVRRAIAIMACFAVCALSVVAVLFKMQVIDYENYQKRVLDQLTVETEVNPARGEIYDRNGNILATNVSNYMVIISPKDIVDAMEDDDNAVQAFSWTDGDGKTLDGLKMNELIAHRLSELPDVDYDTVIEKASKRNRKYEKITEGLNEEEADEIRRFISEYDLTDQIYLRATSVRYYPYSDLCSHVLGFTNRDGVGIYGLESYYNNLLEGTSGRYITAQDAHSNDMPFTYESYIEASNGYNIETTIDVYIQYELENQLEDTYKDNGADERACGIVMDVNTGAILAMATYPPFDLNDPYTLDQYSKEKLAASGLEEGSDAYRKSYYEMLYNMWSNKAVTVLYEPGSTFKAVTATIGFEENVLKESDTFYCSGSYKVDGYPRPISCHKHEGHGLVDFVHGLQQSCNPTMMMLGERIGAEKFYKNFRAFGVPAKPGSAVPAESSSIVSDEKNFNGVSLAVYTFGQTFKVTPIQQIDAIAAIANGGNLVTPHLISRILDDDGNTVYEYKTDVKRQVASESSCERVTTILEAGVSGDGGAKNAYVRGYKVAAKTGTSEKKDKYDENGNTPYRVGSTVAYAPAEDPEIAAIIIVDEPTNERIYGSVVAAPYISNLLSFTLPYLGYEPQYSAEELEAVEVTVGTYVGSEKATAVAYIEAAGLKYEIIGSGDTVTAQIPEAGSLVLKSAGKILLYTGGESATQSVQVPDLKGKTAAAANQILTNMGLNVSFTGTQSLRDGALVTSQSIEAGTEVPPGTVVTLDIKHLDGTD